MHVYFNWIPLCMLLSTSAALYSFPPQCPQVLQQYNSVVQVHNNVCYMFELEYLRSYEDAEMTCESLGGTLVLIKSRDVLDFLVAVLKYHDPMYHYVDKIWIGLNDRDIEGRFTWEDGAPLQWSHWHPGYTSNDHWRDCVYMYSGADFEYEWYVQSCASSYTNDPKSFICQFVQQDATDISSPTPPCEDKMDISVCKNADCKYAYVKERCPRTCNICGDVVSTTRNATTTPKETVVSTRPPSQTTATTKTTVPQSKETTTETTKLAASSPTATPLAKSTTAATRGPTEMKTTKPITVLSTLYGTPTCVDKMDTAVCKHADCTYAYVKDRCQRSCGICGNIDSTTPIATTASSPTATTAKTKATEATVPSSEVTTIATAMEDTVEANSSTETTMIATSSSSKPSTTSTTSTAREPAVTTTTTKLMTSSSTLLDTTSVPQAITSNPTKTMQTTIMSTQRPKPGDISIDIPMCKPFTCHLACGLDGYQVDASGCSVCQCNA